MKKLSIIVSMQDDAPEGSALLEALAELIKSVPNIVNQKSMKVGRIYDSLYGVESKCVWRIAEKGTK